MAFPQANGPDQVCSGALADAGLIFLAFITSIPGLILKANRTWFKVHSWMVLVCILVTLVIGLDIWFSTLKTRSNLAVMWHKESPQIQHLLQERVLRITGPFDMNLTTDHWLSFNVADT